MKVLRPLLGLLALVSLWLSLSGAASAAAANAGEPADSARIIVRLKAGSQMAAATAIRSHMDRASVADLAQQRALRLSSHAGTRLSAGRMLGTHTQVLFAAGVDSATLARRMASHPEVLWAVVSHRRHFTRVPNDPLYAAGPANGQGPDVGQWYLHPNSTAVRSAINAEAAWDLIEGKSSVVVAVIDTGALFAHPDLASAWVAGYDMISVGGVANDGNGRDADASDPGDWVTTSDTRTSLFSGCDVGDSSWHGTLVAGLIGAVADNGVGIAGVAHGVRVQPVRVLGKCGGYDDDIIAGMLWAAGQEVPGLPVNTTPARVLNLSLGSEGTCDAAYQEAMTTLTAMNVVVVAAAGNSTGHAVSTPANCPGVVAVAGLRHVGSKVGFSDLGPEIAISAPAGNCINVGASEPCLYPIVSSTNTGTRSPLAGGNTWSDSYNYSVGTSFSSPLVAGTVALLLSARPELTRDQIVEVLRRSARPFVSSGADNGSDPTPVLACRAPDSVDQVQCYCSTSVCGAGMLDALAAVQVALNPVSSAESARQLLNFGEQTFPQFFPDRLPTQSLGPWDYRYYPSTGVYLGVAVRPDPGVVLNGVYVLGGPFGGAPLYVGQLSAFITPAGALPASPTSAAAATRRAR